MDEQTVEALQKLRDAIASKVMPIPHGMIGRSDFVVALDEALEALRLEMENNRERKG